MSIVKSIDMALSRVKKTLGSPFPIPPKTAEAIRDRRKSLLHLDDLHGKYGMTHTGWTEFIAPANLVGVVDPVMLHMMHVELSEIHNLPISLIAGLEYAVAHEGAEDGMSEAEELLLLPPPLITIPMEMMEQLDNTNTQVGYDMEMA